MIIGNESHTEKVYGEISDYVNEQLTLYSDGEIPYDELSAKLWAFDAASVG